METTNKKQNTVKKIKQLRYGFLKFLNTELSYLVLTGCSGMVLCVTSDF